MKKIFIAFVLGQLLQLALHAASLTYFPREQIALCAAAGILAAVTLMIGVGIARRESRVTEETITPPALVDAGWSPIFERYYHENQTY